MGRSQTVLFARYGRTVRMRSLNRAVKDRLAAALMDGCKRELPKG